MYHFKLFYSVIGGWLAGKAAENPKLISELKQLDGVWVETSNMKSELQALGIKNTTITAIFSMVFYRDDSMYLLQKHTQ